MGNAQGLSQSVVEPKSAIPLTHHEIGRLLGRHIEVAESYISAKGLQSRVVNGRGYKRRPGVYTLVGRDGRCVEIGTPSE